ncbi:hypothetical protein ZIOFF_045327 [Zingiber officinale]|uniref:Uncharacterized protein n=2 Tax=Zingiber officinale TaxID=94328 RepID=A0A8J5G6Q6_ZINOF|nr:hypothetical protein ZIOFF_045327 [Zingiber officinale]
MGSPLNGEVKALETPRSMRMVVEENRREVSARLVTSSAATPNRLLHLLSSLRRPSAAFHCTISGILLLPSVLQDYTCDLLVPLCFSSSSLLLLGPRSSLGFELFQLMDPEMLRLFLRKPTPSTGDNDGGGASGNRGVVEETLSLLRNLESILRSLISTCGGCETRLWLCNTISSFHSIDRQDHLSLFLELLRFERSKLDVASRILQMIFEKRPRVVGHILAKKCYLLEKFFQGNGRRILLWFDHFAGVGESGHRKGARALSLYAFANRDVCWEELEWKGKHGQSPAVVATKPHYFQDLDILQTIQNFLDYVPDFWSSDELAESVKDGEILKIDTAYFIDRFSEMMYVEELEEIWEIIEEFILKEEFSSLSQSLLILLDQESLLFFLKIIGERISLNAQFQDYAKPSCWLEILLSACSDQICSDQISLNEFVLLNAVIANSRQLLRLVSDEEHEEEKGKIAELLKTKVSLSDAEHWAFIIECKNMKLQEATKFAGLLSWVLYYCLSEECMVAHSWETLFNANGITFRKADDYSFVHVDGSEEGCDSDSDVESGSSIGKRKKKTDKKKRKKHHFGDDNLDETIGMGTTEQTKNSGSRWFLSTDGSSCAWNTADLPEHLGRHCFKTWMKWIYSKD